MARPFVNAPAGSVVLFEGREYSNRTSLPSRATEFAARIPVETTAEERAIGLPDTVSVYVAPIPVGTTLRQMREMANDIRDVPIGSREWWNLFRDFLTP